MWGKLNKPASIVATIGLIIVAPFLIVVFYCVITDTKIGINSTPSMPKEVYFYKKYEGQTITKGSKIIFPLFVDVPKEYPFKRGSNFIKIVACTEGSNFHQKITKDSVISYCDDNIIAIAKYQDSLGNRLEPFLYNGKVPKDSYFVNTLHPKSFDSRYYGFVNKNQITGFVVGEF